MPYSRLEDHTDGGGNFTGLTIHGCSTNDGSGSATVMYADIPGREGSNVWRGKFAQAFQDQIDVRTQLSGGEWDNDPWGTNGEDPNREDAFWEGNELVCRSILIVEALWDSGISKASLSIRRASSVVGTGP